MVIEHLTFHIDPDERDAWLDVDARTWTAFLSTRDGFVDKQMWVERGRPDVVHAVIRWRDEAAWQAIPAERLAEVDASMGPWRRPPTLRTFDVVG